ncbi:30S ribosomal protein S3 [Dehalogenimonas etheniformans]|uniref:Small ribosomal subunit protein uS3 n=1 Tax=Dehalogenimonas etheniformans TaxID=1536648 RepID=A0A2P5P7J4_9CHLR|nr:30S ribosomal protein S3 [Dehalogenimonas etheniformans]PPD58262.1 30S ribosomal protein S3 [Dehalogenimonas etheniformans]QNT75671.1 30S ribosomal protein S3 [Dehalogenimonas etheniformans]
MGRKVHPYAFRIGAIKGWNAKWYADKHFSDNLLEDLKLRQGIKQKYVDAGISNIEVERQANKVSVTVSTSRPGIVIGRGGQRVDEMRKFLEELAGKRIQLNIHEIGQPELDAFLVARSVADQMERRIAYRRAMKQAMFRTRQSGAKGIKIACAGRLGGVEIARREMMHDGRVPLHTIRADIDYGFAEAKTALGRIGVKVWIYRGDILPENKAEAEEAEMTEMTPAAPVVQPAAKSEATAAESPAAPAAAPAAEAKPRSRKKAETAVETAAPAADAAPAPKRRSRKAEEKTEEA